MNRSETSGNTGRRPHSTALRPAELHIWSASLDAMPDSRVAELRESLSPDELKRAARFYFSRDCRRFTAARGILRDLLSGYSGVAPADLTFVYGPHGKPAPAPALSAGGIRFNVSHSQGMALYVFAHEREVGVDIEGFRPGFARDRLAERFFSTAEVAALQALPPEDREAGFFRCWTRKEAFIKAVGKGLALPLSSFDVALDSTSDPVPVRVLGEGSAEGDWFVQTIPTVPGFEAAVAGERGGWELRMLEWRPE